mmetsp:Transcript_46544/g.101459  ORF Transcript_46544/g.101459 Transcript_46544/m.101459 type:complete len:100 (-) Transcript_46544:27-326(-)
MEGDRSSAATVAQEVTAGASGMDPAAAALSDAIQREFRKLSRAYEEEISASLLEAEAATREQQEAELQLQLLEAVLVERRKAMDRRGSVSATGLLRRAL